MVVVSVMVALKPLHRSVTMSYHGATANWWAGKDIYVGPAGMNYLPHFAILYSPFHFLPLPVGEVLWRCCAAAALGGGLWYLVRAVFRSHRERPFLIATLVAMPLCMLSLRNGNANAQFGGVVLWSVIALLNERWWAAAGLMVLATAVKPLGIVLILLAPLCYGPLRGRLPVALLGLALFPFLFGSPAYVWSQHREAWSNLQQCAVVTENRFADINGLLRTFGTEFNPGASKLVRVLAGGLTAVLWWWGARGLPRRVAGLWFYALATAYLMLFNPMNEANSYVILAPALGVWAAFFLCDTEETSRRGFGWALLVMGLTMGLLPNIVYHWLGNYFSLFWHPCMTIVFLVLLTVAVWKSTSQASGVASHAE
jgi:hypothetical protein